jgi:hypothetical protein
MENYKQIYDNHLKGIPPSFGSAKIKYDYFRWVKRNGLKSPKFSAEYYVRTILKELNLVVPEKIIFEKVFNNPLITVAVWLCNNTTLSQKEVARIIGFSTMAITNNKT